MKVLLTGGTGFVGSNLAVAISQNGHFELTVVGRRKMEAGSDYVQMASCDGSTNWRAALSGKNIVIHAAARAHILKDNVLDPLAEYQQVNVEGTLNLALQAAAAGVKRFIFISSIGVNGNINTKPFTEDDEPNPTEPYAQSKWEAEQGLWTIQRETGLELVIVRPPLVYGPDAPGNFGGLMRWVRIGVPLPLGAIKNQRSLVALDNLVDLITTCIVHPAAANQVFLAGDGHDLSTTELLRGVARAMGRPSRLIPVPASFLMLGASLLGRKAMVQRLLGSLQVDISKARDLLGWVPPITVEEGLRRCFVSQDKY